MKKVLILVIAIIFICLATVPSAYAGMEDTIIPLQVGTNKVGLTLSWAVQDNIKAGTYVRVLANGIQPLTRYDIDSVSARVNGVKSQITIFKKYSAQEHHKDWMFFINNPFAVAVKLEQDLPSGAEFILEGKCRTTTFSGKCFKFRMETADKFDGPWKAVSNWNAIDFQPDKVENLEVFYKADGRVHLLYSDRYGNPASPGKRTVTVSGLDGKAMSTAQIDNTPALDITIPENVKLPERLMVKDDKGLIALSTAKPPTSINNCNTYFGEIHWHSEFSGDGYRPLKDCFLYARNELSLDFATPGDHSPLTREDYLDIVDQFNAPGKFVSLLGYEMSLGCGHFNIYYRDRSAAAKFPPAWVEYAKSGVMADPTRLVMEPFYKLFDPEEVVMIPHHTNTTSGGVVSKQGYALWRQFDWRAADERYTRVAEIVQVRGCFEAEDVDKDWQIFSGGYGSSIRSALAQGHRFGFVGGTDNHDGWPTRNAPGYGDNLIYTGATAVQAKELTREAVFNAIRERRTYATTGIRVVLDFSLNGKYPMGSEAKLAPGTERKFHVVVKGTAPLDRVEIISQGAKLASLPLNGTDIDTVWVDPRKDAPIDNCYYYLRVRQKDGHCAWSSPIWINYKKE